MAIPTILHCDVNNFYASVEISKDPSLRGKAIVVCGDPDKRHGIVLAKSYPAKACGIKTGDVLWEAKKKCPDLILLPADYHSYMKYSDIVFEIYTRFTDRVEPYGLDECWLDCSGSLKLFGSGQQIADKLREIVTEETGLTISVGVSFTKAFAKLGSDMRKPDATTVIMKDNYKDIIWSLPVSDLIMVGRRTEVKLNKFNINTIGDLARADKDLLHKTFGIVGIQLIYSANGIEDTEVRHYYDSRIPKSVGHSTTTPRDMVNREEVKAVIFALSDQVSYRLRKYGLSSQGISLYTRNKNLEGFGRQMKLDTVTDSGKVLADAAMKLLDREFSLAIPLRAVGVSAINLHRTSDCLQMSIYDDELNSKAKLNVTLDRMREKYGCNVIKRGTVLENIDITDIFDDDEFLPFKK